jgi:RNA polymerase sigma-70 factor (ECF subfamily)
MTSPVTTDEPALVEAARRGDEAAYGALFELHRRELHAHCYRMLASVHDADEAVQDVMVKAWRGLPTFEARSTLRTWLFRIATHAALDVSRQRRRREVPVGYGHRDLVSDERGGPTSTILWVEPFPDAPEDTIEAKETLELAYVAALQELPVRSRATFILREILTFSALEVAEILDTTVPAVNSALQRARRRIAGHLPRVSQQLELGGLGDEETRRLAVRYARAIEEGDVDALLALLAEDATWSMPPHPGWYAGHPAISRFLRDDVMVNRWRHVPLTVNGQLAVAGYLFDVEQGTFRACALDVLSLEDGRIGAVLAFLTAVGVPPDGHGRRTSPGVIDFGRYGLPDELPA